VRKDESCSVVIEDGMVVGGSQTKGEDW
jgi:hypothetical protein